MSAIIDSRLMSTVINQVSEIDYNRAEQQFIQLLEMEDLDKHLNVDSSIASEFEAAIASYQKALELKPDFEQAYFQLDKLHHSTLA